MIYLQYRHEIIALYNRQSLLGSICRQLIAPPTTVVKLPKRTSNGFTSGSEERLPPRLSLRLLANYTFLMIISFIILISWLTKYVIPWFFYNLSESYLQVSYILNIFSFSYDPFIFLGFMFVIWIMYIVIRATLQHYFPSDTSIFRPSASASSINRWYFRILR